MHVQYGDAGATPASSCITLNHESVSVGYIDTNAGWREEEPLKWVTWPAMSTLLETAEAPSQKPLIHSSPGRSARIPEIGHRFVLFRELCCFLRGAFILKN
ncbi:hypothetical protein SRHO_G00014650 [Serrasalmus rhombeus]